MEKQKDIVIYSMAIGRELLKMGFAVRDIAPNIRNKGRVVFFFRQNPAIEMYLQENHGIKFN